MNKVILFLLISLGLLYAQDKVSFSGKVIDNKGSALPGVNVLIGERGAATSETGSFLITGISKGNYRVKFSMVGYAEVVIPEFQLVSDTVFTVVMREKVFQFDAVVVSAGKHEQSLSDLPVSAAVMSNSEIERKNFVNLDDALRYVPGVSMTLDQLSIRGSSGYSRGAGTRVLVALDGIPMYTGDSGEIIWEVFPMPEISRVEVIKGAASSLYGSSAIGGVVNVITKEPGLSPLTFIRTYAGFYDKPSNESWEWSDKTRMYNGLTVGYSNGSGPVKFSLSFTRTEDMSYRQGDWKKRYAGYAKIIYDINEENKLTLLANGYTQDKGTFNFWKNFNNALVPPDGDQGQRLPSERILTGIIYNSKLSEKISLTNRLSFYHSFWKDGSESLNSSNSKQVRNDLQFDYKISEGWLLISGIEMNHSKVNANIFGINNATGIGVYFHSDYKLNPKTIVTGGVRYDYNKRKGLTQESAISPKLGINYKFAENLSARFFFGTGFRAPSVAETFTSTTTSGITVQPNLNLKSENNYSFETGINYAPVNFLELDAAVFYNRYFDLIETRLDTTILTSPYIIFDNVTNAAIAGFDFTSVFNYDNVFLKTGYTYLDARDIDKNKALKYRPKHLLYASISYTYDIYEAGVNFRYASKVDEVDDELVDFGFVADGEKRVEIRTFDLWFSASFFRYNLPLRAGINIYNLFNYNYVEMLGNVSPIRNISLNLDLLM